MGTAAVFLVLFAAAVAFDQPLIASLLAALAIAPILGYVAYRWPMVFPFGAYALSVPFDPLLKASSGTGGTITKLIGLVTIAALLFYAFRTRRLNAPPKSVFFWGAYMFWAFTGWSWSIVGDDTANDLQIVGSLFGLYLVAALFPISAKQYIFARRAVVAAGVLMSAYGIYAYQVGQRAGGRLMLTSGKLEIDSNHFAAFFAIPIAILASRFFLTRSLRERIACGIMILPMFLDVLLSGSRGGLLDVIFVVLYIGFCARRFILLGSALVAATILSFAIPNVWARVFDSSQGDGSGRSEIWNVGILAAKHYGIFGSGFGTFADAYDENLHNGLQRLFAGFHRPAHNILIQTIVELGIPGVIFLLAAWWASLRQNRTIPRRSPFYADRISYEAALIGIFISALTIDLVWFKYLWLCLMLVVMLTNVVRPRLLLGRPPVVRRQRAMQPATVREHVRL